MAKNYQVGLIIKGNAKGGVTAIKATKDELAQLNKGQKRFQKDAATSKTSIGGMASKFGLLKGVIAGLGIGALAKQFYTGIDAMQGMEAQLLTITGSSKSAGLELDRLVGFAKKTPFTIQQSVDAFSRLINMGLNPSEEAMMSYGNTAAAMGKDMMQMVEAVADAAVGEFERLKEFGIKAKNNGDDVAFTFKGNTQSIKNDAASIEEYLQGLGNNEFAGSMTNQMTRLSAKTSNLGISFMGLAATLGDAGLTAVFGYVIDSASTLVDWLDNLIASGEAMDSLTIWAQQFGDAWSSLKEDLNITDEVGMISAGFDELGKYGQIFIEEFAARFGYLFDVIRDLPAHLRTIIGIVFGEIQILWEKVQTSTVVFFSFLDEGWQNMGHAANKAWGFVELSFAQLNDSIINMMSGAIKTVADGLSLVPGMGEQAASAYAAASALSAMAVSGAQVQAAQEAANKAHAKQIEIITLTRSAAKADSDERINDINARILNVIKERDALIAKSNTARAAAAEARKSEQAAKVAATEKIQQDREIAALAAKTAQPTTTKEEDDFYQKAIDGVNGYADAWSSAGNVIIDTFGTIGQQLEKMVNNQNAYTKAIDINHKKQRVAGADIDKLKKEENTLTRANAQSEINSYGSIAGAAAAMFNEKSKAAKTFHAIEQVMAVASLAMSVQKMLSSTTETAVVVGNETIKQTALGTTAIITQGQGDPYTAWVRIAAMAALVAGLGIATSGGSGSAPTSAADRQEAQGTGTVLGSDDKSASINNSFERIEELELDQYAELREMNSSLRDLNNNITHLAASVVSNFGKFDEKGYGGQLGTSGQLNGDLGGLGSFALGGVGGIIDEMTFGIVGKIIGGFKSTKKSLVDSGISIVSQTMGSIIDTGLVQAQQYFDIKTKKKSFWGAKKKTSYNTEYNDVGEELEREMSLIFSDIGSSINNAVDVLGIDVGRTLNNFIIDLPNISLKDLSGDEIQAELEAVFSSQADLMSTYLVPSLSQFQQVGEGLYETLVRIAQQQAVFNSVLDITGNSIASIDANAQIEVAQSIIKYAGSIEALQSAASTYLSEFFTEQEQFGFLTTQIKEQFSALSTTLPGTREEFKNVIAGLDLTTAADQRLYAQLMLLVPKMAEYYDALESQGDAFSENANRIKAFNSDITRQLAELDFTPLESKLSALQDEFTQYYNNADGADLSLLEQLQSKKRQAIVDEALANINTAHENAAAKLIAENDKMVASFEQLSSSIAASILSIKKQASGWNESDYQTGQVTSLTAKLGTGTTAEQLATIEQLTQAYIAKHNADVDGLNQSRDAAQSLYNEQLAQIEEQYQLELDIYNNVKEALLSLKDAADSLLLSDYSTLTNEQKLNEAQSQFESLFANAQNGDVDALNKLSSAGDNYLKEAQQYYCPH